LGAFLLAAPAQAQQDRLSTSEKGSIVIIPKVEIRWVRDRNDSSRWNHLAATVTLVRYIEEGMWEYSSYNVAAVTGAHGAPTGTPGVLNLNGVEFGRGFDLLLINFLAVGSEAWCPDGHEGECNEADTDLTLMPLDNDFRQETTGPVITKASFDVWNMNEWKFTNADRCITCWDQALLSNYGIPNHFLLEFLQTDCGKARVDGKQSALCPGSQAASLVGVVAKIFLEICDDDGGTGDDRELEGMAGTHLVGMGTQNAVIQYDIGGPPPENNLPEGSFQKYLEDLGIAKPRIKAPTE
jgi:hypothetical protein